MINKTTDPPAPPGVLTPGETARALGTTVKTLARWDAEGKLSSFRTAGGIRRFRAEDITAITGGITDPVTAGDVARMFRVDTRTVARWAKDGKLSFFRTPGGAYRYSRAGAEALVRGEVQ